MTPPEKSNALQCGADCRIPCAGRLSHPLVPLLFPTGPSIWISIVIAALTLFIVGVHKACAPLANLPQRLQMAVIGTISALAGYVVGLIFKVPTVP